MNRFSQAGSSPLGGDIHGIDDAYYRGFGGQIGGKERETSFLAVAPVDGLPGAGADGVQRDDRAALVAALAVERLNDQELLPE
jgi:hypothetical protein